ncbi:MAG: hypothetical protein JWN41_1186, partial [Thermoleophilia bacterium]|nr:hypothetical protein [Thermoleophilia bacterium]
ATFAAKAAAFRTKAATRLRKVDDTAAAVPAVKKVRGLLNAAAKLRANAQKKTSGAVALRAAALASTPIDQGKLDQAARLDRSAATLVANAVKLEAKAAAHAATAEKVAASAA